MNMSIKEWVNLSDEEKMKAYEEWIKENPIIGSMMKIEPTLKNI